MGSIQLASVTSTDAFSISESPFYLCCLQLAIWSLANQLMGGPFADYQPKLRQQGETMPAWKPDAVQDRPDDPTGGGWLEPAEDWLRISAKPEEIAAKLEAELVANL